MEYDLKLIINVNEINSIVPNYEVIKPSSQNIEVVLSESKAETLFYLLWNKFGDDWLSKCLEGEGYKMIEIEHYCPKVLNHKEFFSEVLNLFPPFCGFHLKSF